jgi:very-short-patch-repair endonuclease
VLLQKRLIVELDGGHYADQRDQDAARTAYLADHGYRVIRFWNEQVNREMDDVPGAIHAALTDS